MTLFGMIKLDRLLQPEKQLLPSGTTLFGIFTLDRLEQPWKQ
jgi:hypothetical protein